MRHDSSSVHDDDQWLSGSLIAYSRTHERLLRNEIAERMSWLAEMKAHRFRHRGKPMLVLVQVAQIGLLKAIERFNPAKSGYFPNFANPTSAVVAVMQANLANHLWSLRQVSSRFTTRGDTDREDLVSHELIMQLLHELPQRQQAILYLQFFEELTQDEIARRIGISQVHAGRLADRSLDYLHFRLTSS